jgi:serine O-acetyltransferase
VERARLRHAMVQDQQSNEPGDLAVSRGFRKYWSSYSSSLEVTDRPRASFRRRLRSDRSANPGLHLDALKARTLLTEIRIEQSVFEWREAAPGPIRDAVWAVVRFVGAVIQWRLFNCGIPGSIGLGLGLRLPHPQSIIVAYTTTIGDWCSIYQNVTIARSTLRSGPASPRVGDRVLVGSGAVVIGEIEVGDDVVVGAGVVVTKSIPAGHLVINAAPEVRRRAHAAAESPDATFEYPTPHPVAESKAQSGRSLKRFRPATGGARRSEPSN